MYLEKLEIQGFKSFANKVTMEFNRGIAAIVGPNGSGKSNVADAVRWVMGEQSLKLLRGKKSEDVIFSGSDKKPRLGLAEVSLHINNEDGTMPIDFPQVVVTRRIYRSGEGEYFLNKKKVRLQDIILLLAKSNFGQRSYSVIGQGMVDSILTASPQERKEFFDEAAGVRQFQIKKEQAEQKLTHTKENLQQAELLLQEIEPRLRSLTRQVHRLERRETIEQELRVIQKEYYANLWKELADQLTDLGKEHSETDQKHQTATRELSTVQEKLEALEQETSRDELFRELQRDYNKILDKKNSLLQDQAVLKGRWEIAATQAGEANRVWLTKRVEALRRLQIELDEDMKPLRANIEAIEGTLDKKKQEQNNLVKQFEEIERQLLLAKERLESKQTVKIPEIEAHLQSILSSYENFIARLDKIENPEDIAKLKKTAREIQQSLARYIKELSRSAPTATPEEFLRLQNQLTIFVRTKDSLVNEINDLVVKLRTWQEKEKVLHDKKTDLEQEVARLDKEIALIDQQTKRPEATQLNLQKDTAEIDQQVSALDQELKAMREKMNEFNRVEQEKKDALFQLQKQFRDRQNALNTITHALNEIRIKQARLETRRDDLEREMKEEIPEALEREVKEQHQKFASPTTNSVLLEKIHQQKHQLELIGGIDEGITEEYKQTNERHTFLKTQSDDLYLAIDSLEKAIHDLDETIKQQFDDAFHKINQEFGKYFKMLFKGGSAKMSLEKTDIYAEPEEDEESTDDGDSDEPADKEEPKPIGKVVTGIEIQAIPPGKRVTTITMLSGGERALTSIALICAIISNNPSPFVILDEVDAALDEANSIKFSNILNELAHKTQFITITHNRATMQKASILYGVTMQSDGVSKLLSVKMEEAEEVIKRHGNR